MNVCVSFPLCQSPLSPPGMHGTYFLELGWGGLKENEKGLEAAYPPAGVCRGAGRGQGTLLCVCVTLCAPLPLSEGTWGAIPNGNLTSLLWAQPQVSGLTPFPSLTCLYHLSPHTILPGSWRDRGCGVGMPSSLPSSPFSLPGQGVRGHGCACLAIFCLSAPLQVETQTIFVKQPSCIYMLLRMD